MKCDFGFKSHRGQRPCGVGCFLLFPGAEWGLWARLLENVRLCCLLSQRAQLQAEGVKDQGDGP